MDATGEYFSVLDVKRLAQYLHSQIRFATEKLIQKKKKTRAFKVDFVHPCFAFEKFHFKISATLTVFIHPFPQTIHKNTESQTQAIKRLFKSLLISY
jgi:hypothetical protein